MPRIYDSASNPVDFCLEHFLTENEAFEIYGNVGLGPDDRGNCFGYDAEHPDYEEDRYYCEECRKSLRSEDN